MQLSYQVHGSWWALRWESCSFLLGLAELWLCQIVWLVRRMTIGYLGDFLVQLIMSYLACA